MSRSGAPVALSRGWGGVIGALACALLCLPTSAARTQTVPLVDHHQHLFSPATVALVAPKPPPATTLPPHLDTLLRTRARLAENGASPGAVYTDDALLLHHSLPGPIVGGDSVAAAWRRVSRGSSRVTPTGWAATESAGHISGYLTQGDGDSARHAGHVLLSVRRAGEPAAWRIAAEAVTPAPTTIEPISAADLVAMLDAAGIRRAAVFSTGYTWGSPNRTVADEHAKVMAENDWTSQQVAQFPERLRGFCGINPLRGYAGEELDRCARDPRLRHGVKMHFGNSVVDYHDPAHIAQLRRVLRAANAHRMAIAIHIRASFSRRMPFGAREARIFLDSLLPAAPDVVVQVAHLAGGGDYNDTAADEALAVLADAMAKRDRRTKNLYVDVSGAVGRDFGIPPTTAARLASRIRRFGVGRVLYGSDGATGGNPPPRKAWVLFRQLPLTDAEFRTIATNVAPYMR